MPSETKLVLVGTNHRLAPLELRERIAFGSENVHRALQDIVGSGGVTEAVILSTCNRVEIVAAGQPQAAQSLKDFVARYHDLPLGSLESCLYCYASEQAVRHLFRVASSLDSMVVGEAQVLGQVKEAFVKACDLGTAGPVLRDLFPRAFRVAKKVRSETSIASNPLSISTIAVELAQKIFEKLEGKSILLVGAGKMAQLASRQLIQSGAGRIWVTSRSQEKAMKMAAEVGGATLPFQNLIEALIASDIVVVSTSAPHFVISRTEMAHVVRQRRNRPIFVIDISVPRNVDPGVNQVDNVFLYDIDDLSSIAENNRKGRAGEALVAEEIIQQEVAAFLRELNIRESSSVIVGLKEKIQQICDDELARTLHKLHGLPPSSEEALQTMARRISNKISHPFLSHLRTHPEETSKLLSEILHDPADED